MNSSVAQIGRAYGTALLDTLRNAIGMAYPSAMDFNPSLTRKALTSF